jgi:hypothetical protein
LYEEAPSEGNRADGQASCISGQERLSDHEAHHFPTAGILPSLKTNSR